MPTTWKSMHGRFIRNFDEGCQKGLIAAAYVASNAVKMRLRGGYTSGAFVTGRVLDSVTRSEPVKTAEGWRIVVGTNVMYALYWELGHFNLFLKRFVRVEHWRLAMIESRDLQRDAFARVFRQHVGKA